MRDNPTHDQPNTHLWLAEQVVTAFPMVTGLKFFTLDCGCIYFHRLFRDGEKGSQTGIYRNSGDGPCETCMRLDMDWEHRVVDETVIYNSKFQID